MQEFQATEPDWEMIAQRVANSLNELSDKETRLLERIFSTPASEPFPTSQPCQTASHFKTTARFREILPRQQDGVANGATRRNLHRYLWEWGCKQLARLVQA